MQRRNRKSSRNTEKTEALNVYFTLVFTAKISLQAPWSLKNPKQGRLLKEDQVREHLKTGYGQGPDGMDLQELRKLALVGARSFLFSLKAHGNWISSLRTGRM